MPAADRPAGEWSGGAGPGDAGPDDAGPGDPGSLVDLSGSKRVHVIGAGGSGMSAIASVLLSIGHQVTGTDAVDSKALRRLRDRGAAVRVGHAPDLAAAADVVVRSTAIPDHDPEVAAVRAAGGRVWRRADVLGGICRLRRTIAVSGTHGKTTTSSMLTVTLRELGWHPSMIVGADIAGLGTGAGWDQAGEWFVVEADESDATFVALGAEAVIVTSVEPDHLEFYGGWAGLEAAFRRFVTEAPGPAVICADDPGAAALAAVEHPGPTVTYGTAPTADIRVDAVALSRFGATFDLVDRSGRRTNVELAVPGMHNVRNASACVAMAVALGADLSDAAAAVGRYQGVARRFERRGSAAGISFVDGYDHLPTEVAAALATARAGNWDRIVAVFQPHRYSRTEAVGRDFADSFEEADLAVITGIYAAGEAPRPGVTGRLVFDAVRAAHPTADVRYVEDLDQAAVLLAGELRPGDLCLTLGAGDVTTLADRLKAMIEPSPGAGTHPQ